MRQRSDRKFSLRGIKPGQIWLLVTVLSLVLAGVYLLSRSFAMLIFWALAGDSVEHSVSPWVLDNPERAYTLASDLHSSGFIPAPEGINLADAPREPPAGSYGLNPDFSEHSRYWLYTEVVNNTQQSGWMLHISNFGYKKPKVLLRSKDGQVLHEFNSLEYGESDINAMGRAIQLRLLPEHSYQLVVEFTAESWVWLPYVALLSEPQYVLWKASLSVAFELGIGIILGIILLGFICWLLLSQSTFFWSSLSSLMMLIFSLEHSAYPEIFWQYSYEKTPVFWFLISSVLFTHLMFAASFLNINRKSGFWYRIFLGIFVITLLVQCVLHFLPQHSKIILLFINYILVWIVILGSGVAKIRSDGNYYIFYILGWLPMILSVMQGAINSLLPFEWQGEISVSYKVIDSIYVQILHMLIHAVALIFRVMAMRQEKEKAEFLSRAKSEFIAHSSHDLNQPLHTMQIYIDSLKSHITSAEAQKLIDGLQMSCQQMNRSFSSIMDLSKLEAGAIKAEFQPLLLASIFEDVRREFYFQAEAKNITFKVCNCSLTAYTDPELFARLLRNLVSNAIKYTDSGKVVLGCRRRGDSVDVQVIDSGCGISEDEQADIFDIYRRSETVKDNVQGSGIGLSIVRHLSLLLEHPVELKTQKGKGSRFTVSVPLYIAGDKKDHTDSEVSESIYAALIIDDEDLKNNLQQQLSEWHCHVDIYLSFNEQIGSGQQYDLLLCDSAAVKNADESGVDYKTWNNIPVAACVAADNAVPQGWTSLSLPLMPFQLRALLNYAERVKRQVVSR